MRRPKLGERLLPACLMAAAFLSALLLLCSRGFPAFSLGSPLATVPLGHANEALIYLMWEDRFPDMLAQAALTLLAAAACISIVRLWRR